MIILKDFCSKLEFLGQSLICLAAQKSIFTGQLDLIDGVILPLGVEKFL
jgi:hypothetical protein